jgi:hypothetical protein
MCSININSNIQDVRYIYSRNTQELILVAVAAAAAAAAATATATTTARTTT